MATSGGGSLTPITSSPTLNGACPNLAETFLSLPEYWDYLQINECAAWGIRNFPTTGVLGLGCGDYWNQTDRHFLATAIAKAERRMEADRWLGFPLRRKYERPRQIAYAPVVALGKYVRGVGVETNAFVNTVALTLRTSGVINDPVTLSLGVSFTDINELIICFPNTLCKILPSEISISGGIATIQIPRCRLLKPQYHKDYKNDNERPNYETDANFLTSVDIYRNYLNRNTGANLVWWRHTGRTYCNDNVSLFSCGEPNGACNDVRQLACGYVRNERLGQVQLEPATNSAGVYSKASYAVRRDPDGIEINYMRGYYERYDAMDVDLQRAVIAWAHNNLPERYCARCEIATKYWQDDNKPVEPAVRMASGQSTWGNYYAEQLLREFDSKQQGYRGGLL